MIQACVILYSVHMVRKIRHDLSLFNEICVFAVIWLFFSNLNLFLIVQNLGLNLLTLSRIRTAILILRSFFVAGHVSIPPLITSYRETIYF